MTLQFKTLVVLSGLLAALGCSGPKHSHRPGAKHAEHMKVAPKTLSTDIDGDGIPNAEDNCPGVKGTAEYYGCAVPQLVVLRADKIEILEKVFFATGSDTLEERSYALLDNIAKVMTVHPEIVHVRVEGHTDNTGDAAFNLDLSEKRAAAVVNYLKTHGIGEARVSAQGFGSENPIADNEDPEGRAANRRVEFSIIGG